jgi:AcrR family transcriptional regulator
MPDKPGPAVTRGEERPVRKAAASLRQRLTPEARLPQLLEAAVDEFAEHGYAGASMAGVATRAGVGKGLLYHYFPGGKADLFKAAVRNCIQPVFEEAERLVAGFPGPRREMLRALIAIGYDRMADRKEQGLFRLIFAEAARFPELAEFYAEEVLARATSLLESVLRSGVESGEFRADTAARECIAQVIMAPMIMGAIWRMMMGEGRAPDLTAMREAHTRLILQGLAPLEAD